MDWMIRAMLIFTAIGMTNGKDHDMMRPNLAIFDEYHDDSPFLTNKSIVSLNCSDIEYKVKPPVGPNDPTVAYGTRDSTNRIGPQVNVYDNFGKNSLLLAAQYLNNTRCDANFYGCLATVACNDDSKKCSSIFGYKKFMPYDGNEDKREKCWYLTKLDLHKYLKRWTYPYEAVCLGNGHHLKRNTSIAGSLCDVLPGDEPLTLAKTSCTGHFTLQYAVNGTMRTIPVGKTVLISNTTTNLVLNTTKGALANAEIKFLERRPDATTKEQTEVKENVVIHKGKTESWPPKGISIQVSTLMLKKLYKVVVVTDEFKHFFYLQTENMDGVGNNKIQCSTSPQNTTPATLNCSEIGSGSRQKRSVQVTARIVSMKLWNVTSSGSRALVTVPNPGTSIQATIYFDSELELEVEIEFQAHVYFPKPDTIIHMHTIKRRFSITVPQPPPTTSTTTTNVTSNSTTASSTTSGTGPTSTSSKKTTPGGNENEYKDRVEQNSTIVIIALLVGPALIVIMRFVLEQYCIHLKKKREGRFTVCQPDDPTGLKDTNLVVSVQNLLTGKSKGNVLLSKLNLVKALSGAKLRSTKKDRRGDRSPSADPMAQVQAHWVKAALKSPEKFIDDDTWIIIGDMALSLINGTGWKFHEDSYVSILKKWIDDFEKQRMQVEVDAKKNDKNLMKPYLGQNDYLKDRLCNVPIYRATKVSRSMHVGKLPNRSSRNPQERKPKSKNYVATKAMRKKNKRKKGGTTEPTQSQHSKSTASTARSSSPSEYCDYHANFVTDCHGRPIHVLGATPTLKTAPEFWTMIFELKIKLIIALRSKKEFKQFNYHGPQANLGERIFMHANYTITLTKKDESTDIEGRVFKMTHNKTQESITVNHFIFNNHSLTSFGTIEQILEHSPAVTGGTGLTFYEDDNDGMKDGAVLVGSLLGIQMYQVHHKCSALAAAYHLQRSRYQCIAELIDFLGICYNISNYIRKKESMFHKPSAVQDIPKSSKPKSHHRFQDYLKSAVKSVTSLDHVGKKKNKSQKSLTTIVTPSPSTTATGIPKPESLNKTGLSETSIGSRTASPETKLKSCLKDVSTPTTAEQSKPKLKCTPSVKFSDCMVIVGDDEPSVDQSSVSITK